MKICPACRKTYTDDGLNFCLDDGSVLTLAGDRLPQTVMMNQARYTDPNPAAGNQPGIQSTYGNQAAYSVQPAKKSSKTWIWVLGILGLLVVLCGGSGVAFFVYVASLDTNRISGPTPASSPGPNNGRATPSPSPFAKADVKSIDLSKWVNKKSKFGNTEFTGGEFFMSSKRKGFYYVVAAGTDYGSESASSSVVLRNVAGSASDLGYGLVFHSAPTPLEKGYALLIDTVGKRYRVVRHEPAKEINVIEWTDSSAIKGGSEENVLEVRDTPSRIELYINGEMVTSIKNAFGYKGGVVGLYSGDAVNVGFKRLEVAK